MKKTLKLMLVVIFINLTIGMLISETKFRVSGRVVNHGKGIGGMKILIYDKFRGEFYDIITDKEGKFEIYLREGKYSIDCNKQNGYYDSYRDERIFEVKNKNIKNLRIEMIKSGRICGRVVTKEGLKIRGTIRAMNLKKKIINLSMVFNPIKKDGSFCVEYIRPCDDFNLMVKLFGFIERIYKKGFSIKEGEEIKGVVIEMPKIFISIEGKLIDRKTGKVLKLIEDGVDNFVISIFKEYDHSKPLTEIQKLLKLLPLGFADVKEDGNFYFYNVKPGRYILKAFDRDGIYKDLKIPIIIEKGKTKKIIIKMEKKKKGGK